MALAFEEVWPPELPLDGIVLTRYLHGLPTGRIRVVEGGHPLPDAAGEAAAREIVEAVRAAGEHDLLVVLLSGGGSALLGVPADGVSLQDLRQVTNDLLGSGAAIQEINTVRKHLTATLGGQLAACARAPILALIISDVTGDDPTHIASGPCAPDPTTYQDALAVLERYSMRVPETVRIHFSRGAKAKVPETPKPGSRVFRRVENRVIATAQGSLQTAARYFIGHDIHPAILGDAVTGEAREVAKAHGALALEIRRHGLPWQPPVALISGGETTVTVRGEGRGGRNSEYLLSLALSLDGAEKIHALACDTDGIDGSEDNAGVMLAPDSLARAAGRNLDAAKLLAGNDAYGFFSGIGDLVVTGPTRTNVNDYRVILIQ